MADARGYHRSSPEADIQRHIVQALRTVLPTGSIVHHSPNEQGGKDAQKRQEILVGMGLHPGFSDLIVLSEGRVMFLEVKTKSGRQSPSQLDFEAKVQAQGHPYEVVCSVNDALGALARHGFRTRIKGAF